MEVLGLLIATEREDAIYNSIVSRTESPFYDNRKNCHNWSVDNPHRIRRTNSDTIWRMQNVHMDMYIQLDGAILAIMDL